MGKTEMSLHQLQTSVHVAKDKRNDFGGYNYRTAEGILAAIKAALPEGAHIVVSDTMQEVAGQIFVTATATVTFADGVAHSASGHAMHPLTKKGMDPSQITGAASSYARKYALGGLVALDDGSSDPDAGKGEYQPDFAEAVAYLMEAESDEDLTARFKNLPADARKAQAVKDAGAKRRAELKADLEHDRATKGQ
jgi:hypothetical protein